ncbi:MAG TPA: DsbA family protein [Acidimicrobiales bacterium]|nr:DsbA family protein [Acidimicrobiales bacterium]
MTHTPAFAVTYDYRCPFARNAHEHVIAGLRAGASWDVTFVPFSLGQMHVAEGAPPVWEDPAAGPTLLPALVSLVVRDQQPEQFLDLHEALFAARHDDGRDLRDPAVLATVVNSVGLDDEVLHAAGEPKVLAQFRELHESAERDHRVFGVPTFVVGDAAVFVRLQHRPNGDSDEAIRSVERVVELIAWPDLNEFKWTTIRR